MQEDDQKPAVFQGSRRSQGLKSHKSLIYKPCNESEDAFLRNTDRDSYNGSSDKDSDSSGKIVVYSLFPSTSPSSWTMSYQLICSGGDEPTPLYVLAVDGKHATGSANRAEFEIDIGTINSLQI